MTCARQAGGKGWFRDEGIEGEMNPFESGARMIAPLSTGELDVASGAVSTGLHNVTVDQVLDRSYFDWAAQHLRPARNAD
jgi:hypothetical protein